MARSKRRVKKRPPITELEKWYLSGLMEAEKHLERPPSLLELGVRIGRSTTPVYRALIKLESLGYCKRDHERRFMAIK